MARRKSTSTTSKDARLDELCARMTAAEAAGGEADPADVAESDELLREQVAELEALGADVPEVVRKHLGLPAKEPPTEIIPAAETTTSPSKPITVDGRQITLNARPEELATLFGVASPLAGDGLLDSLLRVAAGDPRAPSEVQSNAAIALVAGLRPGNTAEAMLATGAIVASQLGAELAKIAMRPGMNRIGFAQTSLNAYRTMAQLLGDLEKRKRGPVVTQKVVVEHVHVGDGGQAIVGAVTGGHGGGGEGGNEGSAHG